MQAHSAGGWRWVTFMRYIKDIECKTYNLSFRFSNIGLPLLAVKELNIIGGPESEMLQ